MAQLDQSSPRPPEKPVTSAASFGGFSEVSGRLPLETGCRAFQGEPGKQLGKSGFLPSGSGAGQRCA